MYASSFCKLMRISVFLYSQHGIRAIKEFENTRVWVSPCGQFQQHIQRPCHTPVVLQYSQSLKKPNHRRNTLPQETFSGDLHSDKRAHQQECLPPIYLPVEASLENTFPHAPTSDPKLKFVRRRVAKHEKHFRHTPPQTGASAVDEPIHSTPCAPPSPEKPSFFTFSLLPLFLRFSVS